MSRKVTTIPLRPQQREFGTQVYQQYGRLIMKIARDLSNKESAVQDLYSTGLLGIVEALAKGTLDDKKSAAHQRNIVCAIARRAMLDSLDSENAAKRRPAEGSSTLNFEEHRLIIEADRARRSISMLSAAKPANDRVDHLLSSDLLDARDREILLAHMEADRFGVENIGKYVAKRLGISTKTYGERWRDMKIKFAEPERKVA